MLSVYQWQQLLFAVEHVQLSAPLKGEVIVSYAGGCTLCVDDTHMLEDISSLCCSLNAAAEQRYCCCFLAACCLNAAAAAAAAAAAPCQHPPLSGCSAPQSPWRGSERSGLCLLLLRVSLGLAGGAHAFAPSAYALCKRFSPKQ
jgi:hypothetical protein